MHHPRGEGRGRGLPRLSENIQVTEVFVIKYECMGALKEYHWDAKGSTYGSLLIRFGEGTTSEAMDHVLFFVLFLFV
jgi:hypothetical protein